MDRIDEASLRHLYLKDTAFQDLMEKRIGSVLLVASPYDAFMLEEDGRVEEQVFMEYEVLGLSAAPRFTTVATTDEADAMLARRDFDLIIAMPGAELHQTFAWAREVDLLYPEIPFVVLTPFSREVSRRIRKEDLSSVDYVFSWLGNVELIVAIIKLLEDRMNALKDIEQVGVQCIMLVEDSVRFYSAVLPHLFNFILTQSREFSTEALNEHEARLRMRGRPKVILARDYEEARVLYNRYGHRMLGVVSDVSFSRQGATDREAGLRLATRIRERDPHIPIIIESSETENASRVEAFAGIFIDKNSKTLPQDLRNAVRKNFGFADFVVRDPTSGREVMRIRNLKELQKNIYNIPAESLFYHSSRNDISRWLYSRALFPIASVLQHYRFTRPDQTPDVRRLIFECIVKYRRMKNRGVVAVFRKDRFDRYSNFARIGQGSLGGKGRGLAFIDSIIKRHPECEHFQGVQITIPRTVVLCTDIFDEFMESNSLYRTALSDIPDERILREFLHATLPRRIRDDLAALLEVTDAPLAVRSSSLLEDSHYQPFAGVYSTYMIPRLEDRQRMLALLLEAVKGVYASVFYAESKAYMNVTRNIIDQEKMAVIIQEVAGTRHGNYFYPSLSGVGRSLNYYPLGHEKTEDGIAEVAVGLGKHIVDGGMSLRFSPRHPSRVLQTSTLDLALRDTQRTLSALPCSEQGQPLSVRDDFNVATLQVADEARAGHLRYMVSTYDARDGYIRDTDAGPGRKLVTFANILKHNVFPLAQCVEFMLSTGQYEMGRPVEIEFAAQLNPGITASSENKGTLYWLQIRPIVDSKEMLDDDSRLLGLTDSDLILRASSALGHGVMDDVSTVVYVRPQNYSSSLNPALAGEIEEINKRLIEADRGYILIGPGRWGSSDNALGIPVKWPQIAGARLIVESALPGYAVEPSQGTHFFQNLTSFGVGYFTVNPADGRGYYDLDYLDSLPAEYESDRLRVVAFPAPLSIAVNGRKSAGVVARPSQQIHSDAAGEQE